MGRITYVFKVLDENKNNQLVNNNKVNEESYQENLNPQCGQIPRNDPRNVTMVNRNQIADNMIHQVRQTLEGYQVKNLVEKALNLYGFNIIYVNKQYFVFPFPNVVLQTELPKFTKICR